MGGTSAPRTTSLIDHLVSIVKAGLASAPFAGGIASLMSDYIPSGKVTRLEEFARQIADDLRELQDRVDSKYVSTDEFAYLFVQCFKGVANNPQRPKLEAFRGILVNAAIDRNSPDDEKEYFLSLVNTFSTLHLRILKFMAMPERYLADEGIPESEIGGGFSSMFQRAIPGVDVEVIKSAFGELYAIGMINTDKNIFGTMTAGSGLQLLRGRVSDLSNRFVSFCTSPRV